MKIINHTFYAILFTLSTIVALSCTSEPDTAVPANKSLYSTWHWKSSDGGIAGNIITPKTEGYERRITLTADGIFTEYVNKKKTIQHKFALVEAESPYSGSLEKAIKLDNGKIFFYEVKEKILVIKDGKLDGYRSVYIKMLHANN